MYSDQDRRDSSRRDGTRRPTSRRDGERRASSGELNRSSDERRRSQTRRSTADRERTGTRGTQTRRSSERPANTRRSSERPASTRRSDARSSERRPVRRSAQGRSTAERRPAQRSGATRRSAQRSRRDVARRSGPSTLSLVGQRVVGAVRSVRLPQLPAKVYGGIALVLVLLLLFFFRLGIRVNGTRTTVWRGTTIEKLVEKGLAQPHPGNLLAVDGSVIEEGGGDICAATINGEKVRPDTKVPRHADIIITDGEDVTEDATTSEEVITAGTSNSSREFDAYWTGSIHLLSDGKDGKRLTRTGKKSGITVSEVVEPAIDAGYITYTASPEDKVICLTFDDGPWPETTSQILDVLEENGAKATFFTIGSQIADEPEQVKRAYDMGCQICTHSWDHAAGSGQGVNLTYMSSQEQIDEIQKGYAAIKEVLGVEPSHVLRAPGGNFYGSIIDTLWPYVDAEIGWDVDTEDWRQPGSDAIVEMILSVQPGQVILMHDGGGDRSETVEALREALPQLKADGYSFITVDEMLAYGLPQSGSDSGEGEGATDSASTGVNNVG